MRPRRNPAFIAPNGPIPGPSFMEALMTTTILIAMASFAAGVITTLSWRKIRTFAAAEEAALVADAKTEAAKVVADVGRKL